MRLDVFIKRFATLLFSCCVIAITGCATNPYREAYLAEFSSRGVAFPVYEKIADKDELSIEDIIHLKNRRVPEDLIIAHLEETEPEYILQEEDIVRLKKAGCSEDLINYLLASKRRYTVRHEYYYEDPYYYPAPYPSYYYPRSRYYGGGYYRGYSRDRHYHDRHHHDHDRDYDSPPFSPRRKIEKLKDIF